MRKSLLKAMAGTALVVGAVAMSSVSAFAFGVSTTTDGTAKTWDFSSDNTAVNYQNLSEAADIGGGIICPAGNAAKVAVGTGNLNIKSGAEIKIPVPKDSLGTITIYGDGSNTGRKVSIESSTEIAMNSNGESANVVAAATTDGYLTVTSSSDYKLKKITVSLTTGTFEQDAKYKATVNLTNSTDTDAKVSLGSASVTVPANGSETLTAEDLTKGSYSLKTDNKHVLSNDKVTVEDADVSVNVTITAVQPVKQGVYTAFATKDGFVESAANTGKYGTGDYLSFSLSKAAVLTIEAKCGSSSNDAKSAMLFYADSEDAESGTTLFELGTSASGYSASGSKTITLPAGEYYFLGKSPAKEGDGTTTVQITKLSVSYCAITNADSTANASAVFNDGKYYAVAVISADDVDDTTKSTVVLAAGGQELTTTDTVYSAVEFDQEYTAESFGGAAGDYLYAAEVTGVGEATDAMDKINHIMVTVE